MNADAALIHAERELPWLRTLVGESAADGLARVEGEGVALR